MFSEILDEIVLEASRGVVTAELTSFANAKAILILILILIKKMTMTKKTKKLQQMLLLRLLSKRLLT